MRARAGWERVARRIALSVVRRMSPARGFALVERAGPGYAWLARRAGGWLLPRAVRTFPARVESLLGEQLGPGDRARLVEGRLEFLLTRALMNQVLLAHPAAESMRRLAPIGVTGAEHLAAALGEGRGVILISGHFGLPPLIRLVLEDLGASVIGVGGRPAWGVDVTVGGDVWGRARGLHRLREHLAENQVCVMLSDVTYGRHIWAPFLRERLEVALGAFDVAQVTRSPLLTGFAVCVGGTPRFQVEIGSALPVPDRAGAELPTDAMAEFVRRYETLAKRYPCQIFAYQPLFASGARPARPGPRPSRG
jgi:lauroyl/myristoyl acyltransferase